MKYRKAIILTAYLLIRINRSNVDMTSLLGKISSAWRTDSSSRAPEIYPFVRK